MSTYATEFDHTDGDGEELEINRCVNEALPLLLMLDKGRAGVELWREDVRRLAEYLTGIVDTVPTGPDRPVSPGHCGNTYLLAVVGPDYEFQGQMRGEGPYDNLV